MAMFASTFRWLQRKRYQYEVTFSLYMLTPTEKFIFNSFLFLFFSMIIIAMTLYLPQHIAFLTNRAWFYYNGEEGKLVGEGAEGGGIVGKGVKSVVEGTTRVVVEKIKETVVAGLGRETVRGGKEL